MYDFVASESKQHTLPLSPSDCIQMEVMGASKIVMLRSGEDFLKWKQQLKVRCLAKQAWGTGTYERHEKNSEKPVRPKANHAQAMDERLSEGDDAEFSECESF